MKKKKTSIQLIKNAHEKKRKPTVQSLFKNSNMIYLILFLALILRLYHLNYPYLDHHAWRQTDTAAMARNLQESGFNIMYPQVDWRGDGPGYVEAEFQLLSYITALLYVPFGVHEYIGRLVVIAFSLASIYYLYKLTGFYFDKKTALFSAFLFAVSPLYLFFSRAFMPESEMIFFSITSLYFFKIWTANNSKKHLLLAILCTTLAFLVKIPTLYLCIPLLYIAYEKYGLRLFLQKALYLFAILVLIAPAFYYYHAYQVGKEHLSVGIWDFGEDKWANSAILSDMRFYNTLYERTTTVVLTGIGAVLALIGLFIKTRKNRTHMFHFWLLAIISYFIIVAKGNMVHDYYQIPLVPVAAVFAGLTLSRLTKFKKTKYFVIPIILIIFYNSIALASPFYNIRDNVYEICNNYNDLNTESSLVITADYGNPEILYYCHAKGWHISPKHISSETIDESREKGAKYLITTNTHEILKSDKINLLNYILISTTKDKTASIFDITESGNNPGIFLSHYDNLNITYEKSIIFDNKIEFPGYNYDIVKSDASFLDKLISYTPDKDKLHITYYWKSLDTVDEDYTIFVHFLNESGQIIFQHDHQPVDGLYPTSKWVPKEIIMEDYWINIPDTASMETYYIRIGLYVPGKGRLNAVNNNYLLLNKTPSIQNRSDIIYNNTFQFLGYDIDKTQIKQNSNFKITYYWKSLKKTDRDYTIFVHFMNDSEQIVFQNDHQPQVSTSNWTVGQIFKETHSVHLPRDVNIGNYSFSLGFYINKKGRISTDEVNKTPAKILIKHPNITHKTSGIYGNIIQFMGYNLDRTTVEKGEPLKVTYFWKSLDKIDINYTIFVHFINENGEIAFQQDHEPAYGIYPTTSWNTGEIIKEEYEIDTLEGNYRIQIGLYDTKTGTRIQLSDGADSMIIGSINIKNREPIFEIIPKTEDITQKVSMDEPDIIGVIEIRD